MEKNTHEITTLMYHRIDETNTNPWGVCVSPQHFEEQVRFVKKHFQVISSTELIRQVTTGNIEENSICITFDDGYADNYHHAKPILEKYDCPATFFIPTAFIGSAQLFWWDALELIFLHSQELPAHLSLLISNTSLNYTFTCTKLTEEQWQLHQDWKWYEAPPTERCAAFLNIWEMLRPLQDVEIKEQMDKIKAWADSNINTHAHRLPMNEEQLVRLSTHPLFTIGLHTHTHPDLAGKDKHFQMDEILLCKNNLLSKYGIESNCLAYPYGRYDMSTLEAVTESGLNGCFTTDANNITQYTNTAKLDRYQAGNWDIVTFKKQLALWRENANIG